MRGFCLVIDIEKFHDGRIREGSALDSKNVTKLFTTFGFEVMVKKNLTYSQIKAEMGEVASVHRGKREDTFICFVLSHGDRWSIQSPDKVMDSGSFIEAADSNKVRI